MPSQQKKTKNPLDLVIVGAGPAGVACAIQAQRDGLLLELISDEPPGGLVSAARRLDNFPAFSPIPGCALAQNLHAQIQRLDIRFRLEKVISISFDASSKSFSIHTQSTTKLNTKSVCLATGTSPRTWPIATKTGMIHRDIRTLPKDLSSSQVLIIGAGEAALDTALSARDRGAEVSILARGSVLSASPPLLKETEGSDLHVNLETMVTAASWDTVRWVIDTNRGKFISDELIVCIGREPRTELLKGLFPGEPDCSISQTANPGLFMAGDVIRGRDRYTATAMGDGQRAAVLASKYIEEVYGA